jgi:murein DD-endopeptidase MepM/ murein hydrolase activator NlpD
MTAVRTWLVLWLALWLPVSVACQPALDPTTPGREPSSSRGRGAPHVSGKLEDKLTGFKFDGGQLDFELYRDGNRIEQVVHNRYAVPVMLHFTLDAFENVEPTSATEDSVLLPAAAHPDDAGEPVVLATLSHVDSSLPYRRALTFYARFGDPKVRPAPYAYALPYPHGLTFAVLQGFHGAFSHRGSNEYAVDFNCPVATAVLAAREGVVVAANASAQGSGTTPEFLDDRRANFVLVQHSDGTIGEYMHLSISGIEVKPGQRIKRGQELALSGNTGFSSTPHLHFQVMTAADDGIAKQSFPFELALGPKRNAPPVQGQRYSAWE